MQEEDTKPDPLSGLRALAERYAPPPPPIFPVDSLREAAPHLRRPFTEHAVKFKVQTTWPKDAPTGALIVPYIDARLVIERLNAVLPHLWHDPEYIRIDKTLVCRLVIDGVARQDIGEGYAFGKGLYSDAFKRAAVKFGIGVSLYAVPKIMLNLGDGHLKKIQQGKSLALTDAGEARCRELYRAWLAGAGSAFSDPLDHGDVEGSLGDPADHGPGEAPSRDVSSERQRRSVDLPPPDASAALAALLAEAGPLQAKRAAVNTAFDFAQNELGRDVAAGQRLRELQGAPDERTLDELLARINDYVAAEVAKREGEA